MNPTRIKLDGRKIQTDADRRVTTLTFYNRSESDLHTFVETNYPVGDDDEDTGTVKGHDFYTESTIWYCDVRFEAASDAPAGYPVLPKDSPQYHRLSALAIPCDLEKAEGYRTNWNHYLWVYIPAGNDYTPSVPDQWKNAENDDDFESHGYTFRWTLSKGEVSGSMPDDGGGWKLLKTPVYPGEQQFIIHTYQITEYGYYDRESRALWAVEKCLDEIVSCPPEGDMGATKRHGGGNWKCEDAQIYHDGKQWVAMRLWTLSGDKNGWQVRKLKKS